VSMVHDERGAGGMQSPRDRRAEAARRPGDENAASFERQGSRHARNPACRAHRARPPMTIPNAAQAVAYPGRRA
jgi:hypothetical protein